MTLEEIINEKLSRLNDIPDALVIQVTSSQKSILKGVLEKIDQLERKNGLIVISSRNATIINQIVNELPSIVSSNIEYKEAVKSFIKEFDIQANINDLLIAKTVESVLKSLASGVILKNYKEKAALDLIGSNEITIKFAKPIQEALNLSLTNGSSFIDLSESIRQIIVGDNDVDGVLAKYSKQIASDLYSGNDRAYTQEISEENGIEFFRYAGGEIRDTRDFCHSRVDKYFHIKEIRKWGNLGHWDGKIKYTNPDNIFTNLGGYNCRHSLIPISLASTPKYVLKRNISNGNLELNDRQKEILGI